MSAAVAGLAEGSKFVVGTLALARSAAAAGIERIGLTFGARVMTPATRVAGRCGDEFFPLAGSELARICESSAPGLPPSVTWFGAAGTTAGDVDTSVTVVTSGGAPAAGKTRASRDTLAIGVGAAMSSATEADPGADGGAATTSMGLSGPGNPAGFELLPLAVTTSHWAGTITTEVDVSMMGVAVIGAPDAVAEPVGDGAMAVGGGTLAVAGCAEAATAARIFASVVVTVVVVGMTSVAPVETEIVACDDDDVTESTGAELSVTGGVALAESEPAGSTPVTLAALVAAETAGTETIVVAPATMFASVVVTAIVVGMTSIAPVKAEIAACGDDDVTGSTGAELSVTGGVAVAELEPAGSTPVTLVAPVAAKTVAVVAVVAERLKSGELNGWAELESAGATGLGKLLILLPICCLSSSRSLLVMLPEALMSSW